MNSEVDNFVVRRCLLGNLNQQKKNGKAVKSQYNWKYYSGIYAPVADEKNYLIASEVMPEIVGELKTLQGKIIYPESAKKLALKEKFLFKLF